jgi:uncharacterized protein (DUF486 family)
MLLKHLFQSGICAVEPALFPAGKAHAIYPETGKIPPSVLELPAMSLPLLLLIISNCFMTLAWYGHLKFLHGAPLWQAVLFGWLIALLEYSFMIPATRMLAAHGWSMGQMKITQEVVTLLVFVPFMIFLFKQPFKLDYLWAGLCLLGCVYFVFRSQ